MIVLLDGSLTVEIYYSREDCDLEDNICLSFTEDCPDEEKVFYNDETNLLITREQALQLAEALIQAAKTSESSK